MTVRMTLRNRVGRLLRIQAFKWHRLSDLRRVQAVRLHRLADRIDPHPRRLVEAGSGRRHRRDET